MWALPLEVVARGSQGREEVIHSGKKLALLTFLGRLAKRSECRERVTSVW